MLKSFINPKFFLSLGLLAICLVGGLSSLALSNVQAQATGSDQCYQTLGAPIAGGLLNDVDYIKVNGVKISQVELKSNEQKNKQGSCSKSG